MPKSNAERTKKSDDKKRAKGWFGRKVWATPAEHAVINATLAELRKDA